MKLGDEITFNICLERAKAHTLNGDVFMWMEREIPLTTGIVVGVRVLKDGQLDNRPEGREFFEVRNYRKIYLVAINMKQIIKVPCDHILKYLTMKS